MRLNIIDTEVDTDVTYNTRGNIRSRGWLITINNPTEADWSQFSMLDTRYTCANLEIAPTTGTLHLQGFVYFHNAHSQSSLKKAVPRARLDVVTRDHDAGQCAEYCLKGDDTECPFLMWPQWAKDCGPDKFPYEFGDPPEQGRRLDLESIAQAFLASDEERFAQDYPAQYVRNFRGLRALREVLDHHRDPTYPPMCFWFWGASGTGKTRRAFSFAGIAKKAHDSESPEENRGSTYWKNNTKWWDGYNQELTVIIDDFDASKWDFRDLLNLFDRYPLTVERKGGAAKIRSEYFIITCEHPPSQYWEGNQLNQITRRFFIIEEIKAVPVGMPPIPLQLN